MIFDFDARSVKPRLGQYGEKCRQAQESGLLFTITEGEYWQWITCITTTTERCVYGGGGAKDGIKLEMDRIYDCQHYYIGNFVASCRHHNHLRSNNWTVKEFMDIMRQYQRGALILIMPPPGG